MPFKFTFLGLEFSNCSSHCLSRDYNTWNKMAKKKKKKLTPQQKKFSDAQRECHAETTSPKDFGKCMTGKLSKDSKKTKKDSKKKRK